MTSKAPTSTYITGSALQGTAAEFDGRQERKVAVSHSKKNLSLIHSKDANFGSFPIFFYQTYTHTSILEFR